jgi:hypothetical protein
MLTPWVKQKGIPVGTGPQMPRMAPAPMYSVADELAKLATLREQGVLSSEEFDIQKARLLGS